MKDLAERLKIAVAKGNWFEVVRLTADLVRMGADMGEMIFGGSTAAAVDTLTDADLNALELVCLDAKALAAEATAAPTGFDPATALALLTLVIELVKKWREKK